MTDREEKQKESHRRSLRMIVLILQLGLTMLTAIFLCGILGRFLGERLHNLVIFPIFLLLGILAGFRSCYQMILKFTSLENPEGAGLALDYDAFEGPDHDEGDEADE